MTPNTIVNAICTDIEATMTEREKVIFGLGVLVGGFQVQMGIQEQSREIVREIVQHIGDTAAKLKQTIVVPPV